MIKAIIMLGSAAESLPEQLVLEAQRAATIDLIHLLLENTGVPIVLSSPQLDWLPPNLEVEQALDSPDQPFHFGTYLADLIEAHDLERVMYFGGGSAPLLDGQSMSMINGLLMAAGTSGRVPSHIVLTNNRHSSDWVCVTQVQDGLAEIRKTNRDNGLAWALQETGDYEVRVLSGLRPATSMDLDTPTDLAIARQHPDCPPNLRAYLQDPTLDTIPVMRVVDVLRREGSQVAIMGRVSPLAWQAVNKVTRCWLRVFAEERGMVGSERLTKGEVRSLVGTLLESQGADGFFKTLSELCDAAIIDSRVMMAAHYGGMPVTGERFASDLYDVDAITDPWLKEFTQAAQEAPIPILLGGHNVVAGGLYAIAELIERGVS